MPMRFSMSVKELAESKEHSTQTIHLWRGMRDLDVGDAFMANRMGGTEVRVLSMALGVGRFCIGAQGPTRPDSLNEDVCKH